MQIHRTQVIKARDAVRKRDAELAASMDSDKKALDSGFGDAIGILVVGA